MKQRLFALALLFGLLLTGCGQAESAASAVTAAPDKTAAVSVQEDDSGYIVPASWTETSVNDGTYAYVTADAGVGSYSVTDGALQSRSIDTETWDTTLTQANLQGEVQKSVLIPNQAEDGEDGSVSYYAFSGDGVWIVYNCYRILDEDTGETEERSLLQYWDLDGTNQLSLPLEEPLGLDAETYVTDLALDSQGNPLLLAGETLYFMDSQGAVSATAEIGDISFGFFRDAANRLYLYNYFDGQVYTLDEEGHALGQLLMTMESNETPQPGGGDYDFLLNSEEHLRGVNLSAGTVTEILSWADSNLTGSVGGVAYLDEDTFLISTTGLLYDSAQVLTLSRVPADQIPEKQVVRVAVGVSEGFTAADSLDYTIQEQINIFNRTSDTYRVELEGYSSDEELNLQLVSGDAPDIIIWNSTAWLEDSPSMTLYAKKGYLTELEPLFDSDPELSTGDFIPNLLALAVEHTGGMYALPLDFYFHTWSASKEYVGDKTSWSLSEMREIIENLPEGVAVIEECSSENMLEMLMQSNIDRFVDVSAGACSFQTQDFYDILEISRLTGERQSGSEGVLLSDQGAIGRLGQFATDTLEPLEAEGQVLIGYPGAGGSGLSIIFTTSVSICAQGTQQDGAWAFLRTLFQYDYQYNASTIRSAVRQDAFEAREDWYQSLYPEECTEELSQAARQLVYDAETLRVYDSPVTDMVAEEAAAYFAGDKTAQEVAEILDSRVKIYLSEQS